MESDDVFAKKDSPRKCCLEADDGCFLSTSEAMRQTQFDSGIDSFNCKSIPSLDANTPTVVVDVVQDPLQCPSLQATDCGYSSVPSDADVESCVAKLSLTHINNFPQTPSATTEPETETKDTPKLQYFPTLQALIDQDEDGDT